MRAMLAYPNLTSSRDKLISLLSGLGIFMRRQGHINESLYLFDCALKQQFTTYKQTLSLLISKGNSQRYLNRLDEAKKSYEIALELSIAQKEDGYLGTIYNALGAMAFEQGQFDSAKQFFIKSMQTSQKISRRSGQVIAGLNLLTLSLVQKDLLTYHRLNSPIRQLTMALDNQDKKTHLLWIEAAYKVLSGHELSSTEQNSLLSSLREIKELRLHNLLVEKLGDMVEVKAQLRSKQFSHYEGDILNEIKSCKLLKMSD